MATDNTPLLFGLTGLALPPGLMSNETIVGSGTSLYLLTNASEKPAHVPPRLPKVVPDI